MGSFGGAEFLAEVIAAAPLQSRDEAARDGVARVHDVPFLFLTPQPSCEIVASRRSLRRATRRCINTKGEVGYPDLITR
jgi:hypothetical protein